MEQTDIHAQERDVVVLGGGAAGLAGATALARSRRTVTVVDSGRPRNAAAAGVHNYLGRDGTPPRELLGFGRTELRSYGGEILDGTVADVERLPGDTPSFAVSLADGRVLRARRLLIASGVTDELPDVPGLAERWGRDVLHCPYCHGYEVRDHRIAVLATGPFAAHQAQLFRQLTDDVTLLLHESPTLGNEEDRRLEARGIRRVAGRVAGLVVEGDRLRGVRIDDGQVVPCDALVVASTVHARSDLVAGLGLEPIAVEMGGHLIGTVLPADPTGATRVPGVYAAGNVVDIRAQVLTSAAGGMFAGAQINADLIEEEVRRAVTSLQLGV